MPLITDVVAQVNCNFVHVIDLDTRWVLFLKKENFLKLFICIFKSQGKNLFSDFTQNSNYSLN